jgi:hypothetical protein
MKVSGIDIESNIEKIKQQIADDKTLSPSMRTTLDLLLLIVNLLCQRLGLNSRNSSKPPSTVRTEKNHSGITVQIKQADKKVIMNQHWNVR